MTLPRLLAVALPLALLLSMAGPAHAQGQGTRFGGDVAGLRIEPEREGVIDLPPGGNDTLAYLVTNDGNATFDLAVEAMEMAGEERHLDLAPAPAALRLDPGANATVTVAVTARAEAEEGTAYEFTLLLRRTGTERGVEAHRTTVCIGTGCPPPDPGEGTFFIQPGPGGGAGGPSGAVSPAGGTLPPGNGSPREPEDDAGAYQETPGAPLGSIALVLAGAALGLRGVRR